MAFQTKTIEQKLYNLVKLIKVQSVLFQFYVVNVWLMDHILSGQNV